MQPQHTCKKTYFRISKICISHLASECDIPNNNSIP